MIYTVTLNPSIDYMIRVNSFKSGQINRAVSEMLVPGGKGINVSFVLNNLGHVSVAMGFVAGFTGMEIADRVREKGINTDFIVLEEGNSRINVKLKSEEETEINGIGPSIREKDVQKLFDKIDQLNEDAILILSGSVPIILPSDIYQQILSRLQGKNVRTVVDTSGAPLVKSLAYHPFLVKPNNHELSDIFETEINSKEEAVEYAEKLQQMGATNVLVSMASEGAVLVTEKHDVYMMDAPKGNVMNSVGAGDSMVAGFVAGFLESNGDYLYAFRKGVCAGSASAFSLELATKEEVEALMDQVTIL